MGRPCTVCGHEERGRIDSALVEQEPNRRVAAQFSLTEQSVRRHRNGHLPSALAKGHEAKEVEMADGLLDQLKDLHRRTLLILADAEAAGDVRTALAAVHVARENLGLLLRTWSVPGRPQAWSGEPRWTPPPDPAAGVEAAANVFREMPPDLQAANLRWLKQHRAERIARECALAEARMRSYLPPPEPDVPRGDGEGPPRGG